MKDGSKLKSMKQINNMKYLEIRIIVLLLVTALISVSCGKNINCDNDCFTPPGPITFRVMNDSIDLLYTGYYDEDSITLYYMDGDSKIDTEISIFNDTVLEIGIIHSNVITWKSVEGYRDFYLRLNSTEIDEIYLVVQSLTQDCCTFHPIMDIEINGDQPAFNTLSNSFIIEKKVN